MYLRDYFSVGCLMSKVGSHNEDMQLLEYASLRQEILQNKSYIFERPLLIVGAFVAAITQLGKSDFAILMPPILIFILLINFWFTANRLRSNARISAYIDVILESADSTKWIGWERSLRIYRLLIKTSPEVLEEKVSKFFNASAVPDALMFYPAIYRFHLGIVIFSIIIYILLISNDKLCRPEFLISLIAMILLNIFLFYHFLVRSPPAKMKNLIERERAIWMVLFEEN